MKKLKNAAKILLSESLLADALAFLVGEEVGTVSASVSSPLLADDQIATVVALAASNLPLYEVHEDVAELAFAGLEKLAASEDPVAEALFDKASKILARMTPDEAKEVLGAPAGADAAALKKLHRKAAMKHHPDRGGSKEEMQRVNEAYALLKNTGGSGGSGIKTKEERDAWMRKSAIMANRAYQMFKQKLDRTFDPAAFAKHFEKATGKKFKISVEDKSATSSVDPKSGETFQGRTVKWDSEDGDTILTLRITPGQPVFSKTLGGPNDDNFHLPVYMLTEIIHANRKSKMAKKDYTFGADSSFVVDPSKLFPLAKLKKMAAGGEKKRKFSKRDMKLGIEKYLDGRIDNTWAYIPLGPEFDQVTNLGLGPNTATLAMFRDTLGGVAHWSIASVWGPRIPKTKRENLKLSRFMAALETEDLLAALRDLQKKTAKETDLNKLVKATEAAINAIPS